MDGYHPPILTSPRNELSLEEKGELPSADVLFLLFVQGNLPNKKFNCKIVKKHVFWGLLY